MLRNMTEDYFLKLVFLKIIGIPFKKIASPLKKCEGNFLYVMNRNKAPEELVCLLLWVILRRESKEVLPSSSSTPCYDGARLLKISSFVWSSRKFPPFLNSGLSDNTKQEVGIPSVKGAHLRELWQLGAFFCCWSLYFGTYFHSHRNASLSSWGEKGKAVLDRALNGLKYHDIFWSAMKIVRL